MKSLTLVAALLLLTLSACGGSPFEASELSEAAAAGQAGTVIGLGQAGAGGSDDAPAAAGEAGASPSVAGSGGSAAQGGSASGGSSSGGTGGQPSTGGAPQGGSPSSAGSGGAPPPPPPPPTPPCSPSTLITGTNQQLLGTSAACLKFEAPVNLINCYHWDGRTLRVNGSIAPCGVGFPPAPSYEGYNYIQVDAGDNAQASIDWNEQ